MNYFFAILLSAMIFSCTAQTDSNNDNSKEKSIEQKYSIFPDSMTVKSRFPAPKGYKTLVSQKNSFAEYLQNLPLKNFDAQVKYYNGKVKPKSSVYISVVDMDIDSQDLQQCADAVMRLRAEYLYKNKQYSKIHFNFLSDGKPRYYQNYVKGDYSYSKFRKYMRYIFSFANTASLKKELKPVKNISEMQIGDVFIQQGNPYGHAIIVVNMAKNEKGEKLFMLAQSYMPAQETQILQNPTNQSISPWYELKEGKLYTPEWTFDSSDLRSFVQ